MFFHLLLAFLNIKGINLETLVLFSFQMENMGVEETQTDLYAGSKGKIRRDEMTSERRGSFSACELHIKEPDEQISRLAKDSFSTTEKRMEAFETHM